MYDLRSEIYSAWGEHGENFSIGGVCVPGRRSNRIRLIWVKFLSSKYTLRRSIYVYNCWTMKAMYKIDIKRVQFSVNAISA